MATQAKRSKLDNGGKSHGNVDSIFIIPQKIQKRRLDILQRNSRAKNLPLVDKFSDKVSHVVSEFSSLEQTMHALKSSEGDCQSLAVVKSSWLSRCIKNGRIMEIEEEDRVPSEKSHLSPNLKEPEALRLAEYACQRKATLQHPNELFTNPLEVLEEYADFKDDELNYARALAFRRASAVLKSLTQHVTSLHNVVNLLDIGEHCLHVIKDVLENGFSAEAEAVKESNWYKRMKLFTAVFGVGPVTAKKWIQMGISTIAEAASHPDIAVKADPRVAVGLMYYDDLNTLVKKSEALGVQQLICAEVSFLRPGTTVELAGGFRRGKEYGHDIDLLISHPDEGQEQGILQELLQRLEQKHLCMYGRREPGSSHDCIMESKGAYLRSTLDHFEKWIGVLKTESQPKTSLNVSAAVGVPSSSVLGKKAPGNSTESSVEPQEEEQNMKVPSGLATASVNSKASTDQVSAETGLTVDQHLLTGDSQNNNRSMLLSDGLSSPHRTERAWVARRVDLIVIPQSQYYYGLVGWTGNRHFNRSLRLYAQKELGMKLTSHGLFDTLGRSIPAKSEKEVFENLKLPYQEPHERNC